MGTWGCVCMCEHVHACECVCLIQPHNHASCEPSSLGQACWREGEIPLWAVGQAHLPLDIAWGATEASLDFPCLTQMTAELTKEQADWSQLAALCQGD